MSNLHTELYPALTVIITQVEATDADLARAVAHFAAQVSPRLNEDERVQLADLLQKAVDLQIVIASADSGKHAMHSADGTPPGDTAPPEEAVVPADGATASATAGTN